MSGLISSILLVSGGVTLALVLLGIIQKVRADGRRAEREEMERLFRPALLELLAKDEPDLSDLERFAGMDRAAGDTVDAMAGTMMSKLRGEDRQRLRLILEHRGAFTQARRDTRSSIAARRIRAVDLLGDGEVLAAVPEMARLLDDPNPAVRKATARAIGKLGTPESAVVLMRELVGQRAPLSVVGMALIHIGPVGGAALCMSLKAEDASERALAADCLGVVGAVDGHPELMALLDRERDSSVKAAAARSLGRLGDPRSTRALSNLVRNDADAAVRAAAATALGRIGDDDALEALVEAAYDPVTDVARAATAALRWIGLEGIERLERLSEIAGLTGAFAREALDLDSLQRNRREVFA